MDTNNSKSLIVVATNSHDAVAQTGGLIRTWSRANGQVTIVTATDAPHPGVRAALKRATRELSGHDILLVHLGLPAGRLGEHRDTLFHLLNMMSPGASMIGPCDDGWNSDRSIVAQACGRVARTGQRIVVRYPGKPHPESSCLKLSVRGEVQQAKQRAMRCLGETWERPDEEFVLCKTARERSAFMECNA